MSTENSNALKPVHGRGASLNPANRFKPIERSTQEDWLDNPEGPAPQTIFLKDTSRSILSTNDSPDIPLNVSLNPYRGCEHGCAYCYARPTHEYFELSAGIDFETKILVKEKAPELLEKELASKKWNPQVIAFSGVTDCYQPIERQLKLTRRCLETALRFRNPVAIVTKNHLVTRDVDVLAELAQWDCAAVYLSIITLDNHLSRKLEPRAPLPEKRLEAIRTLSQAGIPVGVMTAPIIPGLNDHEIPHLLQKAASAGARFAGNVILRLPYGVKALFTQWLETHTPTQANKVLNRLREIRGGELNDSRFGSRMRGEGVYARQIQDLFQQARKRNGFDSGGPSLTTEHFRNPHNRQQKLFPDSDN